MKLDRQALELLRRRYHRASRLDRDPLGLLDRELPPRDLEVVSFIISGLAYGRVEQIRISSLDLLRRLELCGVGPTGRGLADALRKLLRDEALDRRLRSALRGWQHRFNTAPDLIALLRSLGSILDTRGSLARAFQSCELAESPRARIDSFCDLVRASERQGSVLRARRAVESGRKWPGAGIAWFAPRPSDGGTCKRLLMWLRWMVRVDEIDLGLWSAGSELLDLARAAPSAADLFLPVDTHIFRWAQLEGLTKRKSAGWPLVEELTRRLKRICPEDPLRFDFALCQAGMEAFRLRAS